MRIELRFDALLPPAREPGCRNAMCRACDGQGIVARAYLGVAAAGAVGTAVAHRQCRPCRGAGWIPVGFPPRP